MVASNKETKKVTFKVWNISAERFYSKSYRVSLDRTLRDIHKIAERVLGDDFEFVYRIEIE